MLYHPERLERVHPDIARVFAEAGKTWDIQILEGLRTLERQKEMVAQGKSKTLASKHLAQPDGFGHAVDYAKFPVDWKDTNGFYFLGGYLLGVADTLGIKLRFGGDWDGDRDLHDQTFMDLDHVEVPNA